MPPTTPSPYRTTNHWNNHWNNQQEPTLYSSFTTTSLLAYSRCDYICQLTTSPQQKLDKGKLYFRSDLENKKYSFIRLLQCYMPTACTPIQTTALPMQTWTVPSSWTMNLVMIFVRRSTNDTTISSIHRWYKNINDPTASMLYDQRWERTKNVRSACQNH